ncbi:unnamed protein product [Parascedosporium putredinis]|uniref:Transcription factor domain-containing protein n=1 Tax=Parascedosporium putredinis TaxID=1442378 RepID=A0A9P1H3D3_9PEZI|nr:unnamed protein product [Parascedosporium putredinis]CAI7995697.1 unnamed protein product [Parascedosporium putredinis]
MPKPDVIKGSVRTMCGEEPSLRGTVRSSIIKGRGPTDDASGSLHGYRPNRVAQPDHSSEAHDSTELADFSHGGSQNSRCSSQNPIVNFPTQPGDLLFPNQPDGQPRRHAAARRDFVSPDPNYHDLLMWPSDYALELDMYAGPLHITAGALAGTAFTELSDISSGSEPMTSTSSQGSIHTSNTSMLSSGDYESMLKPMEAPHHHGRGYDPRVRSYHRRRILVAAGTLQSSGLLRLLPSDGHCASGMPRAEVKDESHWLSLEKYLEHADWDSSDLTAVIPMTQRTRDKMLAITQFFLHKALDIHRGGLNSLPKTGYPSPGNFNFIVLPPNKMLEYLLRSHVRTLSSYFNLVVAGCVDPNEMLVNNQASTLLVLLMIAQGASAIPMAEARHLATGLTETCRISLFDTIEKNVEFSADPVALRCALLFTILGAWSGDKWLMDIAMGQRGMYLSMLKHAGMLESRAGMVPQTNMDPQSQWRGWLHRESQNRLVYNWVMVDQELSLFHDTAPTLAISDLQCPLPGAEVLWMSTSAEEWMSHVQKLFGGELSVNPQALSSTAMTPSLCDLFHDFLHNNLARQQGSITPMHLRLLLHPPVAALPQEVQGLLQKWYEVSISVSKQTPGCHVTQCNLVLYHLISLNAVTNFPEIERLARREGFDGSSWDLSQRHKRCISNREEAIFHSGQVLRLVRSMPVNRRPNWCFTHVDSPIFADREKQGDRSETPTPTIKRSSTPVHIKGGDMVAVDQVTPEDAAIISYLWSRDGIPVLTRHDGSTIGLDKTCNVLAYGLSTLSEGISTRIGDGIKRKLAMLGSHWAGDSMGQMGI